MARNLHQTFFRLYSEQRDVALDMQDGQMTGVVHLGFFEATGDYGT